MVNYLNTIQGEFGRARLADCSGSRLRLQPVAKALVILGLLTASGSALAQVNLGIAGPLTGGSASQGQQLKNGAELAVSDINAKGGILGQQIKVTIGDDASDPKQGVSIANKFAAEGVKLVIGHYNSGVSIPASDVYSEAGILQITPASTNPKFTERNLWNTFRTTGRDDQQGQIVGEYIAKNLGSKRIAIVHDKTPYGKGLADETKKALNGSKVQEILYEGVNPGEKDYSALVSKLKAAQAEVLFYGGLHTEAGLILRQMRDQGIQTLTFVGDGVATDEFGAIAGPAGEGVLMTFPPDATKLAAAADAVATFKAKGVNPEGYTLYSYAAVQVFKQAADAVGSVDTKKMADYMHSGRSFDTVIGPISYDQKGDMKQVNFIFYEWKNVDGKLTYVQK